MDQSSFQRRLLLEQREYEHILEQLESDTSARSRDRRLAIRHSYPIPDIPLTIEQPQGGNSSFLVYGRNLSATGIAILHGGYVHGGSRCEVLLEQLDGRTVALAGTVRYCRLVTGSCHEIGVGFQERIDPSLFRTIGREGDVEETEASGTTVSLEGTILIADAFQPDLVLLEHQVSAYGPDVLTASTPGAALDAIKRHAIDIVLSGFSVVGADGLRWLGAVRDMGFTRPILVLSAETDSAALDRAQQSGASEVIAKPYHLDLLVAALAALLDRKGEAPSRLSSTAAHQPGMPPLIDRFVEFNRRAAEQIVRLYETGEWNDLTEICNQLRGSGCSYGFVGLTSSAIAASRAIAPREPSDETRAAIDRLAATCRALDSTASAA